MESEIRNIIESKITIDEGSIIHYPIIEGKEDAINELVELFCQFNVSSRRELLVAFTTHILDKLTEYEGQEINEEMVDDFLATNSY